MTLNDQSVNVDFSMTKVDIIEISTINDHNLITLKVHN